MVDFTSYVPPGVYVSDTSQPVVTPTTVATGTVTVIGPSQGYETATDLVQIYSATTTALSHRGVFSTATTAPQVISAPVVKTQAGAVLTYSTDYTWTVDTSGGGGAANAVTYIQRVGTSTATTDGESVTVTYNYADSNYYTPQTFSDPSQVASMYGAAVTGTAPTNPNASQVVCALTLGSQIAMANGASSVMCLALNPTDGTLPQQFQAAYSKIAANYNATLVVPLFVDKAPQGDGTTADAHTSSAVTSLIQDANSAANSASTNGYGRIIFAGVETNYDSTTKPFDQLAGGIASKRTVLAYPNQLSFYNSQLSQTTTVSGYYLAAAMAGKLAGEDPDAGLTNQQITGFNGFPANIAQQQTKAFKDALSKAGVAVAEMRQSGAMKVRHGLTTDMSSLDTREINIVHSGDILFQMVANGLDNANLIGKPITANTTMQVKGALVGILESAISSNVIIAYGKVSVRQQSLPSGDPSVIECQFAYAPAISLNYITATFAIDLNSGDFTSTTTVSTAAAA